MNRDIRVLVSFRGHRKRRRLEMALGKGATGHLIDLWLAAAEDRPEGFLDGWDETDIALAANWEGDASELVRALDDCGWIDKTDDGQYILHDWQEHQGWACGARARSEAAKNAARARWDRRLKTADPAPSECGGNAGALRGHQIRNAPSPSPSPSPSRKERAYPTDSDEYRLADLLFTLIRDHHPNHKQPNLQEWARHIDLAIRIDNRTPEQIERVIRWCQSDDFERTNVLSTAKLRKRFDDLEIKANKGRNHGKLAGTNRAATAGSGATPAGAGKYAGIGEKVTV